MGILFRKQVRSYGIGGPTSFDGDPNAVGTVANTATTAAPVVPPTPVNGAYNARDEYKRLLGIATPEQRAFMQQAKSNYNTYRKGISQVYRDIDGSLDANGFDQTGKDIREISPTANRMKYNRFFVDELGNLNTNAAVQSYHRALNDGISKTDIPFLDAMLMDQAMSDEDKFNHIKQYSYGINSGKSNYNIQPRSNKQEFIDLRKAAEAQGTNYLRRSEKNNKTIY